MTAEFHPRTRARFQDEIRNVYQMTGLALPRPGQNGERTPLTLGVTSPMRGDGKTTFAIGLASSLAQDVRRGVTLIDADFHTHSIDDEYGLSGLDGLAELLDGTASTSTVRHEVPGSSLSIVTAGRSGFNGELASRTERALSLVDGLSERQDSYVVFDLPAVLPTSNAPVLARLCDGVIVVARSGKTTTPELEASLEKLKDCNVLGVVLNDWDTTIPEWVERLLALKR